MRSISIGCLAAVSLLGGANGRAIADTKAEIVTTTKVWDKANRNINPDLIRFGDRWFLVCQENHSGQHEYPGGKLRVLTSDDAKKWEATALIESPNKNRGLYSPKFTITPNGQLMVSAMGSYIPPDANPEHYPNGGGMAKTFAWHSKDGRDWGKATPVGKDYFPFGRVSWDNDTACSLSVGQVCGSITTINIMTTKDGKAFESRYEETFKALGPHEGEFLFDEDKAYCLITGYRYMDSKYVPTGMLGTSKAPYKEWKWKVLDQQVRKANFICVSGNRVIATVGIYDGKKFRTCLCEFQPGTGKFTELLELSTAELPGDTGLVWHDKHLWVSYPVEEKAGVSVYLAKVKLR